MRLTIRVAAAVAAITVATPAFAQGLIPSIIGQTIMNMGRRNGMANPACTKQGQPPASTVAAARIAAEQDFAQYLRLAGATPSADVSALFGPRGQRDIDRYPLGINDIHAANDPLARAYAAATGDPATSADAFTVALGKGTALGRWALREPGSGTVLGYYRVRFAGKRDRWKILTIERFNGANTVPTVPQYCYQPGDLEGPEHELRPMIEPPPPVFSRPLERFVGEEIRQKRVRLISRIQSEP
jgi:hypothetical protein